MSYWKEYQRSAEESPGDSRLLWLSYEELHRDPEGSIRRVAQFLDRPLTDDQVRLIAAHTRFDQMARNPSVNYSHWDDLGLRNKDESHFMRQGKWLQLFFSSITWL